MKKIIMLATAVCAVVGLNAATVSWKITGVQDKTGAALSGGSVYVFIAEGAAASVDTSWVMALAGKGADAVKTGMSSAAINYTMPASTAAGTYSYNTAAGLTPKTNAELGMSGGTQYSLFAVIFDSAEITDASSFFVTAVRAGTTYADTAPNDRLFSLTATGSATPSNWNAVGVPEPTSGLLLLVGGALLALRRKQK